MAKRRIEITLTPRDGETGPVFDARGMSISGKSKKTVFNTTVPADVHSVYRFTLDLDTEILQPGDVAAVFAGPLEKKKE